MTRCFLPLTHAGHTAFYAVDLLLTAGQPPTLVLEWADGQDGTRSPSVAVQLDPRYLSPLAGWGDTTHSYQLPIDSPIPLTRSP